MHHCQIPCNFRGIDDLCKLGKEYLIALTCKLCISFKTNSETFDVLHAFQSLVVAKLYDLKTVRFFFDPPCTIVYTYILLYISVCSFSVCLMSFVSLAVFLCWCLSWYVSVCQHWCWHSNDWAIVCHLYLLLCFCVDVRAGMCLCVSTGVGVRMTEPLYVAPSLADLARDVIFPQNLPSIVCVHVLDPRPGNVVLDMCAAPGQYPLPALCRDT